ncbi:MAG: TonB-dependent receptor [Pyrinomonadaceae bacterium]
MKSLVLTLVLAGVAFAQDTGTLSGVVVYKGKPVSGATVLIGIGQTFTKAPETRTDSDGRFRFENLAAQTYTVWAYFNINNSRLQRLRQAYLERQLIVSIRDGQAESVVLELVPVDISSETIIREYVTIPAGQPQTIESVSKSVDVITGQEMRERADFALVESLRTVPGFRVQQLGGFGRTANIKTRGLRNQDTAVLIDGIRFRDPAAITGDASSFLSDFTLTSVSKIEVLRGSGSSLYGTNAIGGTLDFQTPTAKSGTHGQIGGAFGGLGLGRFRGLISHGLDNGKFGIGAGFSRTVYTKGIDGQDDAHNTNFQTRVDSNPLAKTNISGRIFFSDAKVRLNVGPDTRGTLPASNATIIDALPGVNFTPDANDPDAIQKSRFFSGQVSVNQVITDDFVLNGYYQGLKTRRRNDDGPLGPGFQSAFASVFDGQIHTANARLTWTARGINTLTAGYEFEQEKFGNAGGTPSGTDNFFTRARQLSNTFYAQDVVSLYDGRLQLAGGFRAQRFSLDRPEFSLTNAPYSNLTLSNPPTAYTFDGAVSYFIRRSGTKFRAHVGNGYRVPSLYERFGTFFSTFGAPSFVALGDPFLKPEKTIAFDAGVEQNAAKDRVRFSATYFYTRLNDIIGFGNVVPNIGSTTRPFGGYENQKGGIALGGEFSVRLKPKDRFDIFASHTFTNSDQRAPQISGSGVIRSLGMPDHQFTLVVTQRFKRAWVNFDFLATSSYLAPIFSNSMFNTYIYRFRGNRRGDVTAGYNFGFKRDKLNLRIYGTIENVFNHEYYENGFRTVGATARFGTTFSF